MLNSLGVDLDDRWLRPRIVVPEDFHEAAVSRGSGIGHHDTEKSPLLRASPA
jgi:hypothetical protein